MIRLHPTDMDTSDLRLRPPGPLYRVFGVVVTIWIAVVLVLAILGGVSNLPILEHTARNLYFHVPMWFVLYAASVVGAWHSWRYLRTQKRIHDVRAEQA